MGGGTSNTRRVSEELIEIGGSVQTVGKHKIDAEPEVPFSHDQNMSRRVSQLNFSAGKQLEGYGGILSSQTALINGDDDQEARFRCVPLNSRTNPNLNSNAESNESMSNNNNNNDNNGNNGNNNGNFNNSNHNHSHNNNDSHDHEDTIHDGMNTPRKVKYRANAKHFLNYKEVPITEIKQLCQDYQRYSTLHIELDISNAGFTYDVADAIQILPENPRSEVEFVAKLFDFNLDEIFEFQADSGDYLFPFPSPFSIRQVLTSYLDLMSKPKKAGLDFLKKYVTDEKQSQWLTKLLTGSQDILEAFLSTGTRYSKIISQYLSSTKLSLEQIINLYPVIKPRTYTCASSPLVYPNSIHLCAACHQYLLPSGEMWYGLTSLYLKTVRVGSKLKILHKKNGFELPSLTTPVILLGIGSGIAPLRSIIQHRAALAEQQNIVIQYVKTILLYECNDPEDDFLYYDEICEANRNRSITTCHVAFSQRNGTYRTLIDLLKNPKIRSLISDSMDIEGGRIFSSGNKEMVQSVEKAILQLVMEKDQITENQAIELLRGADKIYSCKAFTAA